MEGLDLAEHGGIAYPDFGVSTHGGISTISGTPSSGAPSYAAIGKTGNPIIIRLVLKQYFKATINHLFLPVNAP